MPKTRQLVPTRTGSAGLKLTVNTDIKQGGIEDCGIITVPTNIKQNAVNIKNKTDLLITKR